MLGANIFSDIFLTANLNDNDLYLNILDLIKQPLLQKKYDEYLIITINGLYQYRMGYNLLRAPFENKKSRATAFAI